MPQRQLRGSQEAARRDSEVAEKATEAAEKGSKAVGRASEADDIVSPGRYSGPLNQGKKDKEKKKRKQSVYIVKSYHSTT